MLSHFRITGYMCTISQNNKHGCPGLHMEIESTGDDTGAEVITCDHKNPGSFYYLIFVQDSTTYKMSRTFEVHDHSTHLHDMLANSGLRTSLYGNTGEVLRFNVPTTDPDGHSRSGKLALILTN